MSQTHADRNMLFGILAMQMDFVTRDQLVSAMQAWVFDKAQPFDDLFARIGVASASPGIGHSRRVK